MSVIVLTKVDEKGDEMGKLIVRTEAISHATTEVDTPCWVYINGCGHRVGDDFSYLRHVLVVEDADDAQR